MPREKIKSLPRTVFIEGTRDKKVPEPWDVFKGPHIAPKFLERYTDDSDKLHPVHLRAIEKHLQYNCSDHHCLNEIEKRKGGPLVALSEK